MLYGNTIRGSSTDIVHAVQNGQSYDAGSILFCNSWGPPLGTERLQPSAAHERVWQGPAAPRRHYLQQRPQMRVCVRPLWRALQRHLP